MHATHETEADTRANRIDPVLRDAGWGVVEGAHVHRELNLRRRPTPRRSACRSEAR